MGVVSNVLAMLDYQRKRRLNNPVSSLVSPFIALLFIYTLQHTFHVFWPPFIKSYTSSRSLLYMCLVVGTTLLNHAINFLVYYLLDKFNLLRSHKITTTNLIWQTNPQKWKQLRNRSIGYNIINVLIIGSISQSIESWFLNDSLLSPVVPSFGTIMYHFVICMVLESFFFYLFHKVGHLYLYKYHKVHHEFHVPTPLATNHFHPIDYFLGVVVPFAVGPKLLMRTSNFHISTFLLWITFRVGEGHDGHSNYQLSWSPFRAFLFSTTSQYHSFHHTHNQGNFGSTHITPDTLLLDNSSFFKYKMEKSIDIAKKE